MGRSSAKPPVRQQREHSTVVAAPRQAGASVNMTKVAPPHSAQGSELFIMWSLTPTIEMR